MRVDLILDPTWPGQFLVIGTRLRSAFGDHALAIHHIGSTSVAGLHSKDVIDVQVTVADLNVVERIDFAAHGFELRGAMVDHSVDAYGWRGNAEHVQKRFVRELPGGQRTHVHVRQRGRFNQRYAVLFRDYLRAHPSAAQWYLAEKRRLAVVHNFDSRPYSVAKDDTCDVINAEAEGWAKTIGWTEPESDA